MVTAPKYEPCEIQARDLNSDSARGDHSNNSVPLLCFERLYVHNIKYDNNNNIQRTNNK